MKICFNSSITDAKDYLNSFKPLFDNKLSTNQIGGLVGIWMTKNASETRPTGNQLLELYAKLDLQTKQETYDQTEVSEKEDILDLLQSIYFEFLNELSDGQPITKALIKEHHDTIIQILPETLTENGFDYISNNWQNYKEFLLKSRLKGLAVPIDVDFEEETKGKDSIGEFSSISVNNMNRVSDETKYLFASLKEENTINGIKKPVNYSKAINTVQNLLKGTSDIDTQVRILRENEFNFPFITQVLDKLGYGDLETLSESQYGNIRTSFLNSFAKAGFDMVVSSPGLQSYSTIDKGLDNSLTAKWKSAFLASKFATIVGFKRVFNPESLEEIKGLNNKEFLKAMGITLSGDKFPPEINNAIQTLKKIVQKVVESKDVTWLTDPILKSKKEGNSDLTMTGSLQKLLDYQRSFEKATRPLGARTPSGEQQHSIANHGYFTKLIGNLRHGNIHKTLSTIEEMFATGKLSEVVIQGMRPKNGEEGQSFNTLSIKDLYTQLISDMFSTTPIFHLPRTADKSREIGYKLDWNPDTNEGLNNTAFLQKYMAYLNVSPEHIDRLFKSYNEDFLKKNHPKWTAKGIAEPIQFWNQLLNNDGGKLTKQQFKDALVSYMANESTKLKAELEKYGVITKNEKGFYETSFLSSMIAPGFDNMGLEAKERAINEFLKKYIFNSLMYGVESTNMLYGSLTSTNPENFFKRTSSAIAEGNQPRTDSEFINKMMVDRPSYMKNFPFASLMRVLITKSTLSSTTKYDKIVGEGKYSKTDVDDAQGKVPLEFYKEYAQMLGIWSDDMNKAFNIIRQGGKLTGKYEGIFPPLKPVGYSLVNMTYKGKSYKVPVFLKCAIYPIFKTEVKGTLNESLYNGMIERGISLQLPQSGIKIMYPSELQDQFDADGNFLFNEEATFEFPVEDFRNQVQINPKEGFKQLIGTQIRKLLYSNMFRNGKALDEKYNNWIKDNIETYQQISDIEMKKLQDKADIKIDKNGDPIITNYTKLVKMFRDELLSRDLPINTVDAINELIDENGQLGYRTIDTLPSRQKIMNVLNSIVKNKLINQYTNGASLVQISSTGWEMPKGSTIETSCAIDFISNEAKENYIKNGLEFLLLGDKTGAAHILLPAKYKPYISKDGTIDEALLINIGYRIPTQGLNSILHLKVVGFLPASYDQVVVMPKEITTQGGSDFDVDKLNLFIPNSIKIKGKVQKITSDMNIEDIYTEKLESLKAFRNFLDNKISKDYEDKFKSIGQDSAIDKLWGELFKEKAFEGEYDEEDIKDLLEEAGFGRDTYNNVEKNIEKLLNKENWVQKYTLKQLQNKLIDQAVEILESPESITQILTPNSSETLKDEADYIISQMSTVGINLSTNIEFKDMFTPSNLVDITNQMFSSKALVGIFASQNTHHVLGQQVGLNFKTGRPFFFNHNKDELGNSTLSGTTNKYIAVYKKVGKTIKRVFGEFKEQLITERLGNEYLTGSVDAAKDPFLFALGVNLNTGGVFSLFERLGGEPEYLQWLMQQPTVKQYLLETNNTKSLSASREEKNNNKRRIIEKLIGKDNSEYVQEFYTRNQKMVDFIRSQRANSTDMTAEGLRKAALDLHPDKYTTDSIQKMALDDFLYLQEAASVLVESVSTSKFDTIGPGQDVVQSFIMQQKYNEFVSKMDGNNGYTLGTIKNDEEASYENIVNDTILKVFKNNAADFTLKLYRDLVILNQNLSIQNALTLLTRSSLGVVTKGLTDDEASLVYGSTINYLIQNSVGLQNKLFYGEKSLANQILEIQKDENNSLHDNYLFKSVFNPEVGEDINTPDIVSMMNKSIDAKEAAFITRAFQELKDANPILYNDMILANFFQTGVVQSPSSYYSYIPYSDVLEKANNALKNHNSISPMENTNELMDALMSNIGLKLKNIQVVNPKESWKSEINIPLDKSRGKEYVKWTKYDSVTKITNSGIFKKTGETTYSLLEPQNMKGLYYNYTANYQTISDKNQEVEINNSIEEESTDTISSIELQSWNQLSKDVQDNLTKSKITPEIFNSMSKGLQEQTIECNG